MNPFAVALLLTTVSLPADGPTITHVGQQILVPIRVDGFDNPTGLGGKSIEVNLLPGSGLDFNPSGQPFFIGDWVRLGNPVSFFGFYGGYADNFRQITGAITPSPTCIVGDSGVCMILRLVVTTAWQGGYATLRLGKSIKELGPEPELLDCAGASLPVTYGNTICVLPPETLGVGPTASLPGVKWYDVAGRRLAAKPEGSGVYFQAEAGRPVRRVVILR